jgi:PAS domain S-box-containing protein
MESLVTPPMARNTPFDGAGSDDSGFGFPANPTWDSVRKMTRRLEASERHLLEASRRLIFHMNNTPLAVVEWDSAGHCVSWNGEAEDLFGRTRGEMVGRPCRCGELIHAEDRPRFLEVFDRLCQGRQLSDFTACRSIHPDGIISHCEWYLSALMDDEGRVQSILAVVNNVTSREEALADLQSLNGNLEEAILERTEQLRVSNEELRQEIEVRRELEDDLIRISEREHRRIGHDLHDGVCQELAGIRFSLEAIARRRRKGTVLRGQLDHITGAVDRAVRHIRLLSRGLAPLELEDGDLATALQELAANTSVLFDVRCTFEGFGQPVQMPIDRSTNLFRIAQEAIQNAIKHGGADQIAIHLDFDSARLVVTDDGCGLEATSRVPQPQGNGMGLRIMHHRADLLEATILIEPAQSRGTRLICQFQP